MQYWRMTLIKVITLLSHTNLCYKMLKDRINTLNLFTSHNTILLFLTNWLLTLVCPIRLTPGQSAAAASEVNMHQSSHINILNVWHHYLHINIKRRQEMNKVLFIRGSCMCMLKDQDNSWHSCMDKIKIISDQGINIYTDVSNAFDGWYSPDAAKRKGFYSM